MVPLQVVPVTTVPAPATLNTRSTGRRNRSCRDRAAARSDARAKAPRSSSRPSPVVAEPRTTSVHWMLERERCCATSSSTSASQSRSTRSHLVTNTTPVVTARNSRMARCSRVCGITPSSAATTSSATSTPVAPATMLRTKSSCPGTSTMLALSPSPRSSRAKPRSMVMPRRFSSAQRSVSVPVSDRTRAVLP